MAQGVSAVWFIFHACIFETLIDRVLDGARVHGFGRPLAFKEINFGSVADVVFAQGLQAAWREQHLSVFAAFALAKMDAHVGRINVRDFNLTAFFQAHTRGVEQLDERALLNGFA